MGLRYAKYIPYFLILGLSAQSTRWNESMKIHVTKMAFHASEAAGLQESAASQNMLAEEALNKARVDRAEATALEEEGEALIAQGEKDAALADADETAEAELAAKAAAEEAAALTDTTEAAAQQVAFEENMAKADANANASLASKHGFQGGTDEVGVGLCELIPILHMLCDFIGGAASIGLDATPTQETARSAVQYAAAASAEKVEDTLLAKAAELHASSISDGEAAAGMEAAAKELEAKAEGELSEGEAGEVAAQEKLAQNEAEEELAGVEKTEATGQEAKAAENLAVSLASGVSAWLDAFLAGIGSLLTFAFFAGRISFGTVSSGVQHATQISEGKYPRFTCFTVRTLSHTFHHIFLIGIISGFFGDRIMGLKTSNVTSRGSLLLQLAAIIGISQSLLLHCYSNVFVRRETGWRLRVNAAFLVLVRSFIIISALAIMEILIISTVVGTDSVLRTVIPFFRKWYLYFFFLVSITAHYIFIERLEWSEATEEKERKDDDDTNEQTSLLSKDSFLDVIISNYGSNDDDIRENSELDDTISTQNSVCIESQDGTEMIRNFKAQSMNCKLIDDNVPWKDSMPEVLKLNDQNKDINKNTHLRMLWRDIELLIIPFELLLIVLMAALLRSCLPNLSQLWPTAKPIIIAKWAERSDRVLPVSMVVIFVVVFTLWLRWLLQDFNKKESECDDTASKEKMNNILFCADGHARELRD